MAFECRKYYGVDGKPGADAVPDPAPIVPKRDVIPRKKTRRDNIDATTSTGRLSSREDSNNMGGSDAVISMPLGVGNQNPPRKSPKKVS